MAQTAVEIFAESLRLRHKEAYNDLYEDIETYYKKIEKEQMKLADENGCSRKQYEYDLEYGGAEYWDETNLPKSFEQYYQEKFGRSNQ